MENTLNYQLLKTLHSGENYDLILRTTYMNNGEKVVKDLKVHKIILAAGSPVFERMIFGGMNKGDVVDVHEEHFDLFYKLLEGIYSRGDSIHLSSMSFDEVKCFLAIAHRYLVIDIVKMCGYRLIPDQINCEAFEAFNIACLYSITDLQSKCIKLFREYAEEVFDHKNFITLNADALSKLLQEDNLRVDSEVQIYKAAIKWCENYLHNSYNNMVMSDNDLCITNCSIDYNSNNNLIDKSESRNTRSEDVHMASVSKDSGIKLNLSFENCNSEISEQTDINSYRKFEQETLADSTTIMEHSPTNRMKEGQEENFDGKDVRRILKECDILKHIRFFTFTPEEFVLHVARKGILNDHEISTILLVGNLLKSPNIELREKAIQNLIDSKKDFIRDICWIKTPRLVNENQNFNEQGNIFKLDFIHRGWVDTPVSGYFMEKFKCCSRIPLIIESVYLPWKDKTSFTWQKYEENVKINIFILDGNGDLMDKLVCNTFNRVRRNYEQDFEYQLQYSLCGPSPVLVNEQLFAVELNFVKGGEYYGGFGYRENCYDNNLICVSPDKCRGMILGFRYKFINV